MTAISKIAPELVINEQLVPLQIVNNKNSNHYHCVTLVLYWGNGKENVLI